MWTYNLDHRHLSNHRQSLNYGFIALHMYTLIMSLHSKPVIRVLKQRIWWKECYKRNWISFKCLPSNGCKGRCSDKSPRFWKMFSTNWQEIVLDDVEAPSTIFKFRNKNDIKMHQHSLYEVAITAKWLFYGFLFKIESKKSLFFQILAVTFLIY